MENKQKVFNKIFKYITILSFVTFLTLYTSQKTGYYEYSNYQKKSLTEEEIKKFEEDIKNGKDISLSNYKENTNISYSNKMSNIGNKLSNSINKNVKKGIEGFFGMLNKMVEE